jgi:hypothetical protein
MDKELVYLFLYNPMVYNHGWATLSVHKTRKGAVNELETHKAEALTKWEEDFPTPEEREEHPFGQYEDWRVNAIRLED